MIENPRTGEQIEFLVHNPALLVTQSTWTRPEHRAAEHIHPRMQETFEVLSGRAAFRIGGDELEVNAGGIVIVDPGQRHLAWNPTDETVQLRIEVRPALRWAEFTERLFAGEDPVALLTEYADEVRLP